MPFRRDPSDRLFRRYCATGDPAALGAVFDRTAGRLTKVALWLTGNRADAEDLLQRTFLTAIEARQQFRSDSPVLPWLMGLLGNQARSQRRERERAAAPVPGRDRVVDPEGDAAARELADVVRAIGERLGAPYREVLSLHLHAGLNAKEIAARLERPSGTVRTQLMRALDLLRRRLPSGFAAGLAATAALGPSALASVRSSVLSAAGAASAAPTLAATTTSFGSILLGKNMMITALLCVLLGGTAAFVASRPERSSPPLPALPHVEAAVDSRQPEVASGAQMLERVAVHSAAVVQDPAPVTLPRLEVLGPLPADVPAMAVAADGHVSPAMAGADTPEEVLLRIDRAAPLRTVTGLLEHLRSHGSKRVQFVAQLPHGGEGCFTLTLPLVDATSAVTLHLHHERPGVPPASVVPVLARMHRGMPAEEPFVVRVIAAGNARFEPVLQVLAATARSGVLSAILAAGETGEAEDAADASAAADGPFAIDLGPRPRIRVPAVDVPAEAPVVKDGPIGCLTAATNHEQDRFGGGAGGRYGGRSRGPNGPDEALGQRIVAGLAWCAAAQQTDGSFLGTDGRPDLEATSLVMLTLLGANNQFLHGEHQEVLRRGIGWILAGQRDDGCYAADGPACVRQHALATYAVSEAYGLSCCFLLRGGLQDAMAWFGPRLQKDGGFARGAPGAASDWASTALALMAFESGEFFRIERPRTCRSVVLWFDGADLHGDPTAEAAELFCRFFAGQDPKEHERMPALAERIAAAADPADPWSSYWTTYALFQMGGERWAAWRPRIDTIAGFQVAAGDFAGSWEPAAGESRLTTTALRLLALQAFYRYTRLVR